MCNVSLPLSSLYVAISVYYLHFLFHPYSASPTLRFSSVLHFLYSTHCTFTLSLRHPGTFTLSPLSLVHPQYVPSPYHTYTLELSHFLHSNLPPPSSLPPTACTLTLPHSYRYIHTYNTVTLSHSHPKAFTQLVTTPSFPNPIHLDLSLSLSLLLLKYERTPSSRPFPFPFLLSPSFLLSCRNQTKGIKPSTWRIRGREAGSGRGLETKPPRREKGSRRINGNLP